MQNYKLFDRKAYFKHLIKRCNAAKKGDSIILASMEFRPDFALVSEIVTALCTAKKRGADVVFMVDSYSLMLKQGSLPGPLFFSKKDPKLGYGYFKSVVDALNVLRNCGVTCIITNKPKRAFKNPYSGRSHIKFAIYNDEVFIGGCNLSDPEHLDVMMCTKNAKLAKFLHNFTRDVLVAQNVVTALNNTDIKLKIDAQTEVVIDCGVKKQSLIYEKALDIIDQAKKEIYMTCQYFPNNATPAELAKAARRDVLVHLAYNHPEQHRAPIRGIQKRTLAFKKLHMPASVFSNQLMKENEYLHAKILLNEKKGIVGSHNFVKFGVNLGTAEIALISSSPVFINEARDWITAL